MAAGDEYREGLDECKYEGEEQIWRDREKE